MSSDKAKSYLRTKVLTATPAELRLMLFDGAIRFAELARKGLIDRQYEDAYVGVTRCQDILMELINTLRPEHDAELCKSLSGLYTFMFTRMMQASSDRKPEYVEEVLKLLRYERETWSMLLEKLAEENAAARCVSQTPQAEPSSADDGHADSSPMNPERAQSLIGGRVSLRG
jgi:flagellar protein FliS